MSRLLDDLIQQSRSNTVTCEAFLQKAEDLAIRLARRYSGSHPAALNGYPGAVVLFNKFARPRCCTLFPFLSRDRQAMQAIFDIIKNQRGY